MLTLNCLHKYYLSMSCCMKHQAPLKTSNCHCLCLQHYSFVCKIIQEMFKDINHAAGLLTILVKTLLTPMTVLWQKVLPIPVPILLLKSTANTNSFVAVLFTVFFYIQQPSFFLRSSIHKVNKMIVVKKMANSLVYSDMMLMSKRCSLL